MRDHRHSDAFGIAKSKKLVDDVQQRCNRWNGQLFVEL
jgi:hypothetical protein